MGRLAYQDTAISADTSRMEETEQIASTVELEESAETLAIRAWRLTQFGHLGFDGARAEMMADDVQIDLAQARRLVALGCPLETAARILL
jgi:hypothetical protein